MISARLLSLTLLLALSFGYAYGEDSVKPVRKAIERSTLDQPSSKPFHLHATVSPTYEDRDPKHNAEIEVWWKSPTQWRREVHSSEFEQTAIVNNSQEWQKNDRDYCPSWLRTAVAELLHPVPELDRVLQQIKASDSREFQNRSHFSWTNMSSDGHVQKTIGAGLDIDQKTGLLNFFTDMGYHGEFSEYGSFQGHMIARIIQFDPNITVRIDALEDLSGPDSMFTIPAAAGDVPMRTAIVDEATMRARLAPVDPPNWPPLRDGPLEGILTAEVSIDGAGKVREIDTALSDNGGVLDAAAQYMKSLQFTPYTENGVPVQVITRLTMPFKSVRPAGTENFLSAKEYFERGRASSLPAASKGVPYTLNATFRFRDKSGQLQEGQYTDIWKNSNQWRREVDYGKSRYAHMQNGDKRYEVAEGPDLGILQFVMRAIEPIPAIDTMVESDWRIRRENVDGTSAVRVLSGYESPDGKLDPDQARGYWFADDGRLLKAFFNGYEVVESDFGSVNGAQVARSIEIRRSGAVSLQILVQQIQSSPTISDDQFKARGKEWNRTFTDQVR